MSRQSVVWLTRAKPILGDMPLMLEKAGVVAHCEALMLIRPLSQRDQQLILQQQLRIFAEQSFSIFISANAVEHFIRQADDSHLDILARQQVYAVGLATAKALAKIGITASVPETLMSSEGLLALKSLREMHGKKGYIFRGVGGRGYLQQQLQLRGAIAEHVELYERASPKKLSSKLKMYLEQNRLDAIVIGSTETCDNLLTLVPDFDRSTITVVPSERVRDYMLTKSFQCVEVAASAMNADMVETLNNSLRPLCGEKH